MSDLRPTMRTVLGRALMVGGIVLMLFSAMALAQAGLSLGAAATTAPSPARHPSAPPTSAPMDDALSGIAHGLSNGSANVSPQALRLAASVETGWNFSSVPTAEWSAIAQWEDAAAMGKPVMGYDGFVAHLRSDFAPSTTPVAFYLISAAGISAAVIGIVCLAAITAALIVGALGCAILLAAIAVAIVVVTVVCIIFGILCNANTDQNAAINLANSIWSSWQAKTQINEVNQQNLLNAWNGTSVALSYEASAAALLQLTNHSFNIPLLLDQSNLSFGMADILSANAIIDGAIEAQLLAAFTTYEGLSNTYGYYCSTFLNSLAFFPTNAHQSGPGGEAVPVAHSGIGFTCAQTFNGLASGAQGKLYWDDYTQEVGLYNTGGQGYLSCSTPVWVLSGSSFFVEDANEGGGSITQNWPVTLGWFPVSGGGAPEWSSVYNVTYSDTNGTAWAVNTTVGVPSGGYYLCAYSSSAQATVYYGFAFPEMTATNQAANFAGIGPDPALLTDCYGNNLAWFSCGTGATEGVDVAANPTIVNCKDINTGTGDCDGQYLSLFGGNTTGSVSPTPMGQGAQINEIEYLMTLEVYPVNTAFAYWAYLHTLGYFSLAQVPKKCVVPSPASLLPENLPPSALATLTPQQILQFYVSALISIGLDFNISTNLSSDTFCNHPVLTLTQGGAYYAGTYAYGYVYVNGTGIQSANGTTPQIFGQPSTWNLSGLIYIAASVHAIAPSLNKTWLLPQKNPLAFSVAPFYKSVHGHWVINDTAPTWCVTQKLGINGCVNSPAETYAQLTGFFNGNSTQINGSAYPTDSSWLKGSANWSMYLTVCYTVIAGSEFSMPTYQVHPATCPFQLWSIQQSVISCDGTVQWAINATNGLDYLTCIPANTGGGGGAVTSGCAGSSWFLVGPIISGLAGWIASVPFIGGAACALALVVAFAIIFLIVLVVLAAVVVGVRGIRGATNAGGGRDRRY